MLIVVVASIPSRCQVTVLRGINLPVPAGHTSASLETYVTIEFPYPTDEPQMARTRHIADANNAEYPESQHKFYIKRNDAKFRRLMNRKELRFAVFYKPGFLRSDRPLGTASLKLAQLEHACTIHESVDLYECEHKKKIEGKLEIKLRIREALEQTKASEILPQRWLVIDRFPELVNPPSNLSERISIEYFPLAIQQQTVDIQVSSIVCAPSPLLRDTSPSDR